MQAENLVSRLEDVRERGPGRWVARCPAHNDKHPSLSIREADDGRILLHCFACCHAADVLAAVGLSLCDLFPERIDYHRRQPVRDRRHLHAAREALKVLSKDALLVAVAAENVARGTVLDDAERELLIEAAGRIRNAREVAA